MDGPPTDPRACPRAASSQLFGTHAVWVITLVRRSEWPFAAEVRIWPSRACTSDERHVLAVPLVDVRRLGGHGQ